MNPAASPRAGAKEAEAVSPELAAADWIGRDRSGDLAIDRASANADFAIAGCAAGVVAVLPTENGRSGGSGGAPPISRAPPPAGSSGFADASLTVEGAGAGLPTTASVPNGPFPLAQLGFLAPGGDALMQVFNRAVADLARLSVLDAHRTVVIAETAVSKNEKSASVRTKEGTKGAEHAGNRAIKQQTLPASTAAAADAAPPRLRLSTSWPVTSPAEASLLVSKIAG